DDEHAVETGRPSRERADGHTGSAHLRSVALAAASLLLFPVEELGPFVERFLQEATRYVRLLIARRHAGTELRLAGRGVDLANFHLIDAQLIGGLREHRLEETVTLHAARGALRHLRRGIGEYVHRAPPHGRRLIAERDRAASRGGVALRIVRTVFAE